MTVLDFEPIEQTGHNCKTVAIAAIDQYYGKLLNYSCFPLHKAKDNSFSIRQLAKRKGSVQGELLEIQQITDCFSDLDYKTVIIVWHHEKQFRKVIQDNLSEGHLMIGFFSVDKTNGRPSRTYDNNEHAAVIHGLENEQLIFTHWNTKHQSSVHDFFQSSQALPLQREPEYYQNIKYWDNKKKYDLVDINLNTKASIIPKKNSGFCCKLVVIKKPSLENKEIFLQKRQSLPKKIKRDDLEFILNRYKTQSCWRLLLNDMGLMKKDSGTILALRELLNKASESITQDELIKKIRDSAYWDFKKHSRVHSFFKPQSVYKLSDSLNTDEVIEAIKEKMQFN